MQLIGWSQAEQNGLFVGSFDDQLAAKTITEGLLDQNVDVIMPVAGLLYQASIEAIRRPWQRHRDHRRQLGCLRHGPAIR